MGRKMTLITWECNICKDVVVSDTTKEHQMNRCKCGVSACDAEEYYVRWVGNPTIITTTKIAGVK